ncbi:MAG: quercetin 2,3-dioxygenase [Rickettsiales bacterium]|nr:quercetin 2,3-dioxygenase [Rickettsiales bacterium]OUV79155.1 MAG: quercetin 2,3-dioxygenase [Rickettsiales bacterium TMED131]
MTNFKKIKYTYTADQKHWVGDGFHVYGLLRPSEKLNKFISPFIMLDYAAPKEFSITDQRRGVGEHPHRGIETVTFAYQGEVEHRDSSGGGGVIKPGDIQWMTAGKGVVHDEFHSEEFSKKGGVFEMVQLWINLPKKHKMTDPKYQEIGSEDIPAISLGNGIKLRVIAGEFEKNSGPSSTFTKMNIYDILSKEVQNISLSFEHGTNTIILIMRGELKIENKNFKDKDILIFDREGTQIDLKVSHNFKGLILNGEPIDEPVVAHGPFVMNTQNEITEAITDYQSGKMGKL